MSGTCIYCCVSLSEKLCALGKDDVVYDRLYCKTPCDWLRHYFLFNVIDEKTGNSDGNTMHEKPCVVLCLRKFSVIYLLLLFNG